MPLAGYCTLDPERLSLPLQSAALELDIVILHSSQLT